MLVLPTILFYSWRESEVNNWRNQTDLLSVYNYIHDCTSNVTAEENKTEVSKASIQLNTICRVAVSYEPAYNGLTYNGAYKVLN